MQKHDMKKVMALKARAEQVFHGKGKKKESPFAAGMRHGKAEKK